MSFHAPYNFVPLSEHVLFPDWPTPTPHDIPLAEGYCGWLDIAITAHTPIMVGDEGGTEDGAEGQEAGADTLRAPRTFFRRPDGTFAIPGSTLRGLIRNVLEIASFGKFSQVDDTRFSVRDLDSSAKHFYLDHFTKTDARGIITNKVNAGWLKFEGGQWKLWSCHYARIEHADIKSWLGFNIDRTIEKSAKQKYLDFLSVNNSLKVNYSFKSHDHPKNFGTLRYDKVTHLDPSEQEGYLVFTGQFAGSNKHMEFVFSAPQAGRSINVSNKIMCEFLSIYGESKAWNYLHSDENPHQIRGVPVFWLGTSTPTSLGLSQMYRLPYEFSVRCMIENSSNLHLSDQMDFVENLFGTASNQKTNNKSRLFFSDAHLKDKTPQFADEFNGVLNSPKPSYYPSYIRQKPDPHNEGRVESYTNREAKKDQYDYATYAKSARGKKKPELQGWKRYPAREKLIDPPISENENINVCFTPLAAQSCFAGRIRLHNLRKEEIGALVWALEWTGKEKLRHLIGMGKAFGYGQVKIEITAWELRPNQYGAPVCNDLAQKLRFEQKFVEYMEFLYTNTVRNGTSWRDSLQIATLLEMARPASATYAPSDRNRGHMELDDFREAKKDGLYLQPIPL